MRREFPWSMSDKRATANIEPKRIGAVPGRSFKRVRFRQPPAQGVNLSAQTPGVLVSFLNIGRGTAGTRYRKASQNVPEGFLRTFSG